MVLCEVPDKGTVLVCSCYSREVTEKVRCVAFGFVGAAAVLLVLLHCEKSVFCGGYKLGLKKMKIVPCSYCHFSPMAFGLHVVTSLVVSSSLLWLAVTNTQCYFQKLCIATVLYGLQGLLQMNTCLK